MIEFKTKTFKKKFEIPDWMSEKFTAPIIFYLLNKDDTRKVFYTFVIVDFSKKELNYIFSFFPENVKKLEQHEESTLVDPGPITDPHCSLQITPGESFYSFMERGNFFLHVDYKKNTMRLLLLGKDVPGLNEYNITAFVRTCFKDDTDNEHFYFSAMGKKDESGGTELYFFKANLDLSDIQIVFQTPSNTVPHVTKKFNEYLFNTEFDSTRYKNTLTGTILKNNRQLHEHVYKELFREFCKTKNREYSDDEFKRNNIISLFPYEMRFEPEFKDYCDKKGKDLVDICNNDERYAFISLPGSFTVVNIKKKTIDRYHTSVSNTAHVEIDTEAGVIYTSSHNFIKLGSTPGYKYLGPAAIDKFVIQNGKLNNAGTFSNPTGYRFTTHRSFYHNGKPYICTIGQPNRLFFVDAEIMQVLYHFDMGPDYLSDKKNVAEFLNAPNTDTVFYIAFEVSSDGEYVFILGDADFYIFSFSERRPILKVPYILAEQFEDGTSFHGFLRNTVHVNYLT